MGDAYSTPPALRTRRRLGDNASMSGALTIIVTGPDQSDERFTFEERELAIGRAPGNDIMLRDINVSRRHARLVVHDGKYIIIDVVSTNGTFVNGRLLRSPTVIGRHDRVQIGGEPEQRLVGAVPA